MTLAFLNIGTSEMVFIIIIILMLFGGKKLPELARGLGRGIRDFKDASEGIKREISDQINSFEKDLDTTVEDKPTAKVLTEHSAEPSNAEVEVAKDENVLASNTEETKSFPNFTAPENTFQHNPGGHVENNDAHYTYGYQDHFAEDKALEERSAPAPEPTVEKKEPQQNA